MALYDEFEGFHRSILHRNPLPFVDSVVSELLAEGICFKSQTGNGILSTLVKSVLIVPFRLHTGNQNKSHLKTVNDECNFS